MARNEVALDLLENPLLKGRFSRIICPAMLVPRPQVTERITALPVRDIASLSLARGT